MNHFKNNIWFDLYQFIKENHENDLILQGLNDCTAVFDDDFLLIKSSKINIKLLETDFLNLLEKAIKNFFGKKMKIVFEVFDYKKKIEIDNNQATITEKKNNNFVENINNKTVNEKISSFGFEYWKKYTLNNFCSYPDVESVINFGNDFIKNKISYTNQVVFFYGNIGVGKTHLACAFLNEYIKLYSSKKVLYVDSNDITFEYPKYFKNSDFRLDLFLKNFDCYDFFVFDDIQKLEQRNKTGLMVFSLIDYLIKKNLKIIFITDFANKQLNNIEPSLKSRILSGLKFEIKEPNCEAMAFIINNYFKTYWPTVKFSSESLKYLSMLLKGDVRIAQGHLSTILFYLRENSDLTVVSVEKLKEIIELYDINTTIATTKKENDKIEILKIICSSFNYNVFDVIGKSRKQEIVESRNVVIYVLKTTFKFTHKEIGKLINRDHSTICNSLNVINQKFKNNKDFKNFIEKHLVEIKK